MSSLFENMQSIIGKSCRRVYEPMGNISIVCNFSMVVNNERRFPFKKSFLFSGFFSSPGVAVMVFTIMACSKITQSAARRTAQNVFHGIGLQYNNTIQICFISTFTQILHQ